MRQQIFSTFGTRWSAWLLAPALLVLAVGLSACNGDDENADAANDEVSYNIGEPIQDSTYAAIVSSEFGSDTLTTEEFRSNVQLASRQMPMQQGQQDEMRRQVLERFIMTHLLQGEVKRMDIQTDTAQVNAQFQQFRQQFPSDSAYRRVLAQQGMTEDSLRGMFAQRVRMQVLQDTMRATAEEPTDAEIDTFRQQRANEVRAQHILLRVPEGAPAEQADSVEQLAEALIDSAQAGTDFAELARRHSDGPSAERGGDLRWFSKGDMVPAFEEAVFALQDSGDVAEEPVRTRFGYHVIRLTGQREAEPMERAKARQQMMQQREQEAIQQEMDRLRGTATVRLNRDVVDVELNANA